jgi:outer membrane protein OmpA-like peptidoglycan-associated protein
MARTGSAPLPGSAAAPAPAPARIALAALLLALGAGDLAVIDLVLLPRHFATGARASLPIHTSVPRLAAGPLVATPVASIVTATPAPIHLDAGGEAGVEAPTAQLAQAAPAEPRLAPAGPVAPVAPAAPALAQDSPVTFPDLLFAINATWLSRPSRETLDQVVNLLLRAPALRVVVSGHTDASGTPDINRALARARARRAGRYLRGHGIEVARIEVRSFGAERPVEAAALSTGRARNRRVEITVQ